MDTSLPALRTSEQTGKRQVLGVLLALALIEGFLAYMIGEESPNLRTFNIGCSVVNAIVIMRWFFLDAKEQNFRLTKTWILMLVGFGIIITPIYFMKTCGKKCLLPVLFFFLLIILFGVTTFSGEYIAYWVMNL